MRVTSTRLAVIFFVPGVDETLRVNGRARLSVDPELLARMAVQGKAPKIAIVLDVREAYLHCAKALKRSKLWDVTAQVPRTALASLGRMIIEQASIRTGLPECERQAGSDFVPIGRRPLEL